MGNCLAVFGLKKLKRPVTLLLVGLDNSGKTTAAKGIVGDSLENVAPTVGFSPETLEYRGCQITMYDLGGGPRFRAVWPNYFSEIHGVIFVIDSSDKARIEECQDVLEELLSHKKVSGKPVLVLANKQDVEGALDEIDLVESLKIEQIVNSYKCPTRVETCSATAINKKKPDKPIADGFRWLLDTIVVHYDNLNKRVEDDVKEERQKQLEEMERRKERIKRMREEREREEMKREELLSAHQSKRRDSDDVIIHKQHGEQTSRPSEDFVATLNKVCEESKTRSRSSSTNGYPNESDGSSKSSSDAHELEELGLTSPNSLKSAKSQSSSSSSASQTSTKAVQSASKDTKSRLIQVHPSRPQAIEERHGSSKAHNEISLEDGIPRATECVPIDSDDEPPSIKSQFHQEEWSDNLVHRSSIAGIKEQIELETTLTRKPKRKNFLKRFHKTAPIESSPVSDGLIITQENTMKTPSGRIP